MDTTLELQSKPQLRTIEAPKQPLQLDTGVWISALDGAREVLKASGLKGQAVNSVRKLLNDVHLKDGIGVRHRTREELCAAAAYIIALKADVRFNWDTSFSLLPAAGVKELGRYEARIKIVAIEFVSNVEQPISIMETLGLAKNGKLGASTLKFFIREITEPPMIQPRKDGESSQRSKPWIPESLYIKVHSETSGILKEAASKLHVDERVVYFNWSKLRLKSYERL